MPDVAWTFADGNPYSRLRAADGIVYAGSGITSALDAETGQARWQYAGGPPLLYTGAAYVSYEHFDTETRRGTYRVYALDPAGQVRWAYPATLRTSPYAASQGMVFAASDSHNVVHALDAETGDLRWDATLPGDIFSVIVADATVYAEGGQRKLYALDAATGQVRWAVGTRRSILGDPVVAGGSVYVAVAGSQLGALDAATGQKLWTCKMNVASEPVAAADSVYINECPSPGESLGKLHAVDAATGAVRWTFTLSGVCPTDPVVSADVVYVGGGDDRKLFALDAATGEVRWTCTTQHLVTSPPVVADGTVYLGSQDQIVRALDAATGQLRWSFPAAAGPQAPLEFLVAGNTVYVGTWDGRVYALKQ